jgi:hypothetical protein
MFVANVKQKYIRLRRRKKENKERKQSRKVVQVVVVVFGKSAHSIQQHKTKI